MSDIANPAHTHPCLAHHFAYVSQTVPTPETRPQVRHLTWGINLLFKIREIIDLEAFDGLMNILARTSKHQPELTAMLTLRNCRPHNRVPRGPTTTPVAIQVPVPVQPYTFIPVQLTLPPPVPALNLIDEDTGPSEGHMPVQPGAPAPPWPPNPKLLRLHTAMHTKFSSEADLLTGEPMLRDEMAHLEVHNIADLNAKNKPDVDGLMCSMAIVHNQLINLVTEDNTIEDTIFHLSNVLNSGYINIERFLCVPSLPYSPQAPSSQTRPQWWAPSSPAALPC
ncbi:hypothetical protein B0H14DRAFT_3458393 [Mycena olivaceomarginata]|nr:hypothetical protein B0H14DRAFT_3458393 [Mycena olivaceomarginata]